MQGIALVGAGVVLVTTVAIGLVAHELMHALVFHSLGVPYDIEWFPGSDGATDVAGRLSGTWAVVTPRQIPSAVPTWGVQLSSLAPFLLALPLFTIVFAGVPVAVPTENPYVAAMTVGWLACSIPSPQDFSVFWYAEVAIADVDDASTADQ